MQSYEVLYINRYARELFGDIEGHLCWQAIQEGQEGPCPFCSNPKLVDDSGQPLGEYIWELQNTRNSRWYELHDRAITWIDDRIVRLEIATDITNRKKTEQALARHTRDLKVFSKCHEVLIRSQSEEELLQDICRIVAEEGGYPLVWVAYLKNALLEPVARFGDAQDYTAVILENCSAHAVKGECPVAAAIQSGKTVYLQDTQHDPLSDHCRQETLTRNLASILALPLKVEENIIGAIAVYASLPAAFDENEQGLLQEMAGNLAYGIAALRAREERQKAEEQLALIVDSLPIVPYTREASGDFPFRYIGAAITRLTGHRPEAFLADPLFWRNHIHPEDRDRVCPELKELEAKGTQKCEYRFQVADGTYRWFASSWRLVQEPDGNRAHIVGAWQDISEEKKVQQEAELRLQQVIQADKLASLGEVVAGVAHEINNPNSFITYNIPLLEESWQAFAPIIAAYAEANPQVKQGNITLVEMAGEMVEIIHAIKTGSDRINKIVANLKDFARLDESAPSKLVDLNKVVADTLTIVGAQARKYVGTIELELAEDLPQFFGHFQKLEQVLANLIMNAAQAMPCKEQGRVAIRTLFNKRLNAILVEVEDNGRGMAVVDTERIFDPFFTTKRDSGGTGLGLSVSYGLVQEHHGRIAVMSRPGKGTKFTVFLPVDRRQGQLEIKPTILCVDDDPQVLSLLRLYFAGVDNMPVETTSSAEGVLAFLAEHPEVDIILSDIMMAGMDGWQLLARVKEKYPLLPVILISGGPSQGEHQERRDIQPDLFLVKPLDFKTLAAAIAKIGRQRL
ncbi:MAG: response regulator [Proteobacteria bacterium]|nr:response regulator [Pseudomonadota bacterium]